MSAELSIPWLLTPAKRLRRGRATSITAPRMAMAALRIPHGGGLDVGPGLVGPRIFVHEGSRQALERRLGLAFQMADDVKGAFWQESASGKAEAGDLRRRKKTMPVIWALNHASDADQARLRELYAPGEADRQLTDAEVDEAAAIHERSGARDTTLAEARRYRDEALAELESIALDPDARRDLVLFVEGVIAA